MEPAAKDAGLSLKRVLDYKLVFDCLADGSNGMVPLQVLSARWPKTEACAGMG